MQKKKYLAVLVVLVLLLSIGLANALVYGSESYGENYVTNNEKWAYKEDLHGHNKGFTLTHTWNSPRYEYETHYNSLDFLDSSRYYAPRSRFYNGYNRVQNSRGYDYLDSAMNTYRLNKIPKYYGYQYYRPNYNRYGGRYYSGYGYSGSRYYY